MPYSNFELRVECDSIKDLVEVQYKLSQLGYHTTIVGAYDLTVFTKKDNDETE